MGTVLLQALGKALHKGANYLPSQRLYANRKEIINKLLYILYNCSCVNQNKASYENRDEYTILTEQSEKKTMQVPLFEQRMK